jgi:hypothetical protein
MPRSLSLEIEAGLVSQVVLVKAISDRIIGFDDSTETRQPFLQQ